MCVVFSYLLDKYMRQDCEREAGNEKHSHAEHRVWIFDGHTCSIGRFVRRCGTKRFLTVQLLDFRSSLARIVHLPVPSENVSRRGKKVGESSARQLGGCDRADGTQTRKALARNQRKGIRPKNWLRPDRRVKELWDATSPRCCALLTLIGVDHPPCCPGICGWSSLDGSLFVRR